MIINAKEYNGLCSCGREHKMVTELAVIERGCLRKLKEYCKEYFPGVSKITAIYDKNTYAATADRRETGIEHIVIPFESVHANEDAVGYVMENLVADTELLVAIGSGSVHDITRYCAHEKKIPFVACPTAASVDGFCSSIAAMTWEGFKKTFPAIAPSFVLADLEIISKAPMRLTRSGFGDMVGKFIALSDWKISNVLTGEYLCDRIYSLMMQATKKAMGCVEGLIAREPNAYEELTGGLILSGIAMQMLGNSRPASGAEHHISHLIEMEPNGLDIASSALHGEKVGVATLLLGREYHRLMEEGVWKDYRQKDIKEIEEIFGGNLTRSILKENEKNCAEGVTAVRIRENLPKIQEIVGNIPSIEELTAVYKRLGLKSTLSDIEIDESNKEKLFVYSPLVRNRLTLMRLRSE